MVWGFISGGVGVWPRVLKFEDYRLYRNEVITLSGLVEGWTPLRGFCERHCPDEVAKCTSEAALVTRLDTL